MTQLRIDNAGMLSLIQDLGRFGQSHLGLTTGGPADKFAFVVANRLLQNDDNAAAIEVAVGGFSLQHYILCILVSRVRTCRFL